MDGTQVTPRRNGDGDEAENQSISESRTVSPAEDIGPVEAAIAARESRLTREIEKQRHEKAVLEEKHEFERLEKLKAEAELKETMIKEEAVSEQEMLPEENADEANEVISARINKVRKGSKGSSESETMQRRRSDRLASTENVDPTKNNLSSAAVKGNGGLRMSDYERALKKQRNRKNMEIMKRGKRKGKTDKRRGEEYVQYRCNLLSFFNTMQRIKGHLSEGHLELLQKTPFWPLVSAFYHGVITEDQCKKSESDVLNIIKCYNSRTMRFEFGSKCAQMTTEDIAEILGLAQQGEELQLRGSRKYESDFTKRYFDVKRVYKTMVDDALDEAIYGERETDVVDVVRLILIELCITFLLCNSGQVTSWNLVKYCEDLDTISRYSWAKAVADLLHKSLKKNARRLKPYSAPGCVVAIMLWLCEKTNLIQPIKGREGHTPAIVKWSMQELHLKLKQLDVVDIGLSFEKDGVEVIEETQEEAMVDGREEGENVFDDTEGLLDDELEAQMTQTKSVPMSTVSKKLNKGEGLERRREGLWDMVQSLSAEVAKAQGKVNRLTMELESKKGRTKKMWRKLKEEKKVKRKLEEENEMLIAEKKSLFGTMKKLVKKLEASLEAEREEAKNLEREKLELMKENQELKDELNEGSGISGMQIEASPDESNLKRPEKSIMKRALDPEFEHEEKRRKMEEGKC